jgi:divinyl chlorophyllide a 8-vinyl-reductase
LASRTGGIQARQAQMIIVRGAEPMPGTQDSWDVDYQATLNCLEAGREKGVKHFVLLSAICVQRPLLTFQKAKLKFEAALQAAGDVTYSIVRPTAFMKSLAGQVLSCKGGGPYVMFGDGNLASCKVCSPILPICRVISIATTHCPSFAADKRGRPRLVHG